MLLLLNGVENLEGASLGVLAPDIRDSFGVSDGVIVFVSAASGAFIVLGALPMGWLADRYRRPPIIAAAAVDLLRLRLPVRPGRQRLHPVPRPPGRGRRQVVEHHGPPVPGRRRLPDRRPRTAQRHQPRQWPADRRHQPRVGRRHRHVGGRAPTAGAGPSSSSGCPALVLAFFALRIPEAPRGQFEMKDVLGEVIDTRPTPMSVESVFARLKQIRTLPLRHDRLRRARLRAVHRSRSCQGLYVEDEFDLDALERGLLGTLGGLCRPGGPAVRRHGLRRPLPRGPGEGAAPRRAPDHARRRRRAHPVLDAERPVLRPRRRGAVGPASSPRSR